MRNRQLASLLALGALLVPFTVQADGMVIPPPNYWIEETGQKAVIFHEKGVETLVLSTSFRGDAKDFAWIVPSPSKPEVSKGSQELFTNLQRLTQVSSGIQIENVGGTLGLGADTSYKSPVTVIEEKQVDYYDVAVLAATDKDALANWLKEKGYNFPESASYLLQEYINNSWYFVAMRVNPESLVFTNVNQQLRQGSATPVVLRFSTEHIVYPLRISSALEQQSEKPLDTPTVQNLNVPVGTLVPGAFDQALSLTSGSAPVYTVGTNFPNRQGGISAHIKLREGNAAYRSILSLHDSAGADRMQFRLGTDSQGTFMQFIQYPATGGFVAWRTEQRLHFVPEVYYHVAVIWSADKQPEFYLNGVAQKTVAAYGETTWFGKDPEAGSKVVIGGRGAAADVLQGDIDDVVVYNRLVHNGDIMNLHNNAANMLTISQSLKGASFYGSYDGNSAAVSSDSAVGSDLKILTQLPSFTGAPVAAKKPTVTIPSNRSQAITLYVITDERKDATNFNTSYANWFPQQTVRDLAFASDGAPLLPADSKKLFVTVLTRTLSGTGTLDDVFFRSATSQETIGPSPGESGADLDLRFWIFLGGTIVLSGVLLTVLLVRTRKSSPPAPLPPNISQ